GLLTIGASGVVSGIVTFRLNAARDSRRMRREKLEQLFLAHTGFVRQLETNWMPYMAVMQGRIDYNAALQQTIDNHGGEERHLETVEMLVNLYFPELTSGLEELLSIRDESARIIHAHKEQYRQVGPHQTPALQAMSDVAGRLGQHRDRFRTQM